MNLLEKSELEAQRARRVAALRELCQGEGVGDDVSQAQSAVAGALEIDPADVRRVLDEVDEVMPQDNQFLKAFFNAFYASDDGANLTGRRTSYLAKNPTISARTLMRYEAEGAELFVRQVELVEDFMRRQQEAESAEDAVRDLDIAALRERLDRLEARVAELEAKPAK